MLMRRAEGSEMYRRALIIEWGNEGKLMRFYWVANHVCAGSWLHATKTLPRIYNS